MSANQTMYEQNVYFPDAFKGCGFDCIYCVPSFQRQAKRQKQRCQLCYEYKPHFHPERLYKPGFVEFVKTPVTNGNQFIFFPKGGDPCFATEHIFNQMLAFIDYNSQTTFLMQTKSPGFLQGIDHFPSNLIVGITLETNREWFTGSKYHIYSQISQAPPPHLRGVTFRDVRHNRKFVTIEPILQFDFRELVELLDAIFWCAKDIEPRVVYVGYDTKKCRLPEPSLAETMQLISRLEEKGFTVRRKTLRKAWWE